MSLPAFVIHAVISGRVAFSADLASPRFCQIGDLLFVRPVVGGHRWCLCAGKDFHHVAISWAAHLALECARGGWQSRAKGGGE